MLLWQDPKGQQLSENEIELLLEQFWRRSLAGRAVISMNRNWRQRMVTSANYNTVAHLLMVATKDYFTRSKLKTLRKSRS
jgi:hypothetical protein